MFNTTGSNNIFAGTRAGWNIVGNGNIAAGFESLRSSKSGDYNIAIGYQALSGGTQTYNNVALGYRALYSTTGANNVSIGYSAGYNNTTGITNVFTGNNAGYSNITGSSNVFTGYSAGYSNTTGGGNVFLGNNAGYSNTTGRNNTYVGITSGGTAGIDNATAIGSYAYVSKSNSLVLGSSTTNVGIGVSAPAYQLQLSVNSAAKPGSSTWTIVSDKRLKTDIAKYTKGVEVLKQINPVSFKYNGKGGISAREMFVGIIAQDIQKILPETIKEWEYQDEKGSKTTYLGFDANELIYIIINSVKEQQLMIEEQKTLIQSKDEKIKQLEERMNKIEQILQSGGISSSSSLTKNSISINSTDASLEQNVPNPFSESTTIKYHIPQSAKSAAVKIYSLSGSLLKNFDIRQKGPGQVSISGKTLSKGTYIYTLSIDNQIADTKKMELL